MIDIVDKSKCCGCTACKEICPTHCIDMQIDYEGFFYPNVDKTLCIDCKLCEKVCPINNRKSSNTPIKIFTSYCKDASIRNSSSSGGIFTLLAEQIINEGGVVFGARFDRDWNVEICYVDRISDIRFFRGSKYVQANIGKSYRECKSFLDKGIKVLYSGTPCQVAGLKNFLGKEYENLVTSDFLCHGVPSPLVWQKYLKSIINRFLQSESNLKPFFFNKLSGKYFIPSITEIKFRDKSKGWKNYRLVLNIEKKIVEDGKIIFSSSCKFIDECHKDNIYMKAFLSDLISRPVCYSCPFRVGGQNRSDITLADFWGVKDFLMDLDDDKGLSLAIINTSKGLSVFSKLDVFNKEISINVAQSRNVGIGQKIEPHYNRKVFFSKLDKSGDIQNLLLDMLNGTRKEKILGFMRTIYYKLIRK